MVGYALNIAAFYSEKSENLAFYIQKKSSFDCKYYLKGFNTITNYTIIN